MTSKDYISPNEFLPVLPDAPSLERLFPHREESSRLLVGCIPAEYSASRIARAVEDADAHLLNLNVTSDGERMDNRIIAELRVSHRSPMAVARSLERYGYDPYCVSGTDSRAHCSTLISHMWVCRCATRW